MARLTGSHLVGGFVDHLSSHELVDLEQYQADVLRTHDPNQPLSLVVLTWWRDVQPSDLCDLRIESSDGKLTLLSFDVSNLDADLEKRASVRLANWRGYGSVTVALLHHRRELAQHTLKVEPPLEA